MPRYARPAISATALTSSFLSPPDSALPSQLAESGNKPETSTTAYRAEVLDGQVTQLG